jgi:hypothetical protein
MRKEILSWENLTYDEKAALTAAISNETDPISLFNDMSQETKDSLINIYYLSISDKVAGNIWQYIKSLRWAGPNQIGVYVQDKAKIFNILSDSKNFVYDDWLTCLIKKSFWSLRQIKVNNEKIEDYGMQIYAPIDDKQKDLIVIDIDTIVFSSWISWPRHALDILRPDPELNNPLRARQKLVARGIFPN